MNNISNNFHSKNIYEINNVNAENKKIQNSIEPKTNHVKNQNVDKFLKNIQNEIQKAQSIAINFVKGNKVTKEELEFIIKKYPDIKQIADQSIKDYKTLIKELKTCKTDEEIQQVISKAIKKISDMVKMGHISEVQSKVKMFAIEGATKFSEQIKQEIENAETIALKIIKGEKISSNEQQFITKKYPNIKQIVEETIKEIINLKEDLRNCKTDQERQKLLLNSFNDLENKKRLLSKTEMKIKMSALEEVKKFLETIKKEVKKLELISIKIIKGQKLTKSEEKFINEKAPHIKTEIQDEIKEYNYVKEKLKHYQHSEKEQIVFRISRELEEQIENGEISEIQARIKMELIENIKIEYVESENIKEESLSSYINSYIYTLLSMIDNNLGIIVTILIAIGFIYFF